MPMEVVSARETGTSTAQTAVKVSPVLKPSTHFCVHAERGSVACEQQSSRMSDVAVGRREGANQCVETRLSQRWGRLLWRKQGLPKERPRSSQECNMLIADA